jgi:hypothetical protein
MQSRKPGIWVVRANPAPMIPIPTGFVFICFCEYRLVIRHAAVIPLKDTAHKRLRLLQGIMSAS